MLESLRIVGFRSFDSLEIPKLGRVNLIVGANAIGKSTVLEAVHLLARGPKAIEELGPLLVAREEYVLLDDPSERRPALDWLRLFHGAQPETPSFQISAPSGNLSVALGTARQRPGSRVRWEVNDGDDADDADGEEVIVCKGDGFESTQLTVLLDRSEFFPLRRAARERTNRDSVVETRPCIMVRAHGINARERVRLWENVVLRDSERLVIAALQLIDPTIERITFITHPRERILVKRTNREPEPLSSLGDGMIRLAEVSLALANARAGYLLIDEIESGVHYSVQPDLWRMLLETAKQLDIQVFAATHSWDCITAFQEVLASEPADMGVLVRINRDADGSYCTTFAAEELRLATKHAIEVR